MARRGSAETLALAVYQQLRADIVAARIGPGERLRPAELQRRFGVSLAVVREALARLGARGLVRVEPNRGFHVASLSASELLSLVEARRLNEGHAVRLAVERGDVTWESELVAAHHRLERTPVRDASDPDHRSDEWAAAHTHFHAKLREGCGNPVLIDICNRLSDVGELYRGWAALRGGARHRDFPAEHRELLQAALDRDADRAGELCERHIQITADILLADPPPRSGVFSRVLRSAPTCCPWEEGPVSTS